ncbi:MAG: hypothetical protein RW306_15750 [Geobacteraceae bacterium]|nr:hypothetical protein [Geobacteraceae bacterium]
MEIFGGFMVMMSIIGLFLAVIWLIMPFVVLAIKSRQDRTLEVLEGIEKRLASLEAGLQRNIINDAVRETAAPASPLSAPESEPHVDGVADSR